MTKDPEKQKNRPGKAVCAAAFAAAAVIILLLFLYRDRLVENFFPGGLGAGLGVLQKPAEPGAYEVEAGGKRVCAMAGDCLAVATTSGAQLFDGSGKALAREFFSMTNPAIAPFDGGAAFYDVSGRALRIIYKDGKSLNLDTDGSIITVSANKAGALAVVTEKPGYRACVTILDKSQRPAYEWDSGSLSILSAQVSPSGARFSAAGISSLGATIITYSLSDKNPESSIVFPGDMFFELRYVTETAVAAVALDKLVFIDPRNGKSSGEYDFADSRLADYDLRGDGFAAVILGNYENGAAGELITINPDGGVKGSSPLERAADAIDVSGDEILILCGGSLTLYNSSAKLKAQTDGALGIQSALLAGKGQCLAVMARTAEKIKIN